MTNYTDTTGCYYDKEYCQHRLPCGYCPLLEKICPLLGMVRVSWRGEE